HRRQIPATASRHLCGAGGQAQVCPCNANLSHHEEFAMKLISESFADNGTIPERNAFAKPDGQNHVALAGNANPQLAWSDIPEGVQSFAIICHDPDVPSKPDDVNQEGREIPDTLPRVDFFHWVLIEIGRASCRERGERTGGVVT